MPNRGVSRTLCIMPEQVERNLIYNIEKIKIDSSDTIWMYMDFGEFLMAKKTGKHMEYLKPFVEKVQRDWNNGNHRSLINITAVPAAGHAEVKFHVDKIKKYI